MRLISFMLTVDQFNDRSKDVTRRLGWENLKPRDLLKAVRKAQGLKKGEHPEVLGIIRVKDVRRERLDLMIEDIDYGMRETVREGFPNLSCFQFVAFFCKSHKGCTPGTEITRIEFEHMEEPHG